jgi:hypothetical protein
VGRASPAETEAVYQVKETVTKPVDHPSEWGIAKEVEAPPTDDLYPFDLIDP